MPNAQQNLNSAIQSLTGGHATQANLSLIIEAIASGELQLERTISVGGDIVDSVVIVGNNNTVSKITLDAEAASMLARTQYKPPRKPAKGRLPKKLGLPPASRMLYTHNKLFTGREEALLELADTLLYKDKNRLALISQAIQGMGGIGKTQLAVEFAYRYGIYFYGVHWINAATPSALEDEIAACGSLMNLQPWGTDQKANANLTIEVWKASGPRLVVLDNLEDQSLAREWFAKLVHKNLRLLITSRQSNWPFDLGLQPLTLEVFTKTESLSFLRKYLPDKTRATKEELEMLSVRLGHLPLALELAGRYLASISSLNVHDYIAQLNLNHPSLKKWRAEKGSPTQHELDVAQTFALSWSKVRDENARELFIVAGYFTPNLPIPQMALAKEIDEETPIDEALSTLMELALLKPEIALHPLLSEFARSEDKEKKWLFVWAKTLARACYPSNSFGGIYSSPLLVQHARGALPNLQKAFQLVKKDKESATLFFHAAFIYKHFGDLDEAIKLYQQSLEINRWLIDLQSVSITLREIAEIYVTRGALHEAMKLYQESLNNFESLGDLQGMSATIVKIADIHSARGKFGDAMKTYQRALQISEKIGDTKGKALALRAIANIQVSQGDLDEALISLHQAMKLTGELKDKNGQVSVMYEQAKIMQKNGNINNAIDLYQQALEISEQLGDLQTKSSVLMNMANVYVILDNLDKALDLRQQALQIKEELGDLQGTATALDELAEIQVMLGNLDNALSLYQSSYNIYTKIGNLRGKSITSANIGQLMIRNGEFQYAAKMLVDSYQILRTIGLSADLLSISYTIRGAMQYKEFNKCWIEMTGQSIPNELTEPIPIDAQFIKKPSIPKDAAVLVVEDNVSNFVLIARMLGYLGIHCEWKTSGYEVVEYADTLPRLDLILMDIRLPYEDGYGALKKIRTSERFKSVPIIAVTAEASQEQMKKAKDSGFDGFLGKPLDPDRFPDQIRRILNGEPVWEI